MDKILIKKDEWQTICKCADEFEKFFSYANTNEDNLIAVVEYADTAHYKKLADELYNIVNKTRRCYNGTDERCGD